MAFAGTTKRTILYILCALLILAAAGGIASKREAVKALTHTRQKLEMIDGGAQWFKILQRSDPRDSVPVGIFFAHTEPHCPGAYKNRSGSPPLHWHLYDDEIFEVQKGKVGYVCDGLEGEMEQGKAYTLPAGTVHTFWNLEPDHPFEMKTTMINRSGKYSPMERFFEQFGGLIHDHGGNMASISVLQLILTFKTAGIELAVPAPVGFFLRHFVCAFAQLLGYKGFYPEYVIP